jgi:hypothetical protein
LRTKIASRHLINSALWQEKIKSNAQSRICAAICHLIKSRCRFPRLNLIAGVLWALTIRILGQTRHETCKFGQIIKTFKHFAAASPRSSWPDAGRPIILQIASRKLHLDGYQFYKTANNVWLVEHIPFTFITAKIKKHSAVSPCAFSFL